MSMSSRRSCVCCLFPVLVAATVTPHQFADAAEGVYWHARGMQWNTNGTHIVFAHTDRPPVPMARLHYLAGVTASRERRDS